MKEVQLTQGKVALVDDEEFERVNQFKWCFDRGYAIRTVMNGGKQMPIFMHRFILDTPPRMVTDHIDHDTLNNQRYNLRICTNSQNLRNSTNRKTTSEYKGVSVKVHRGRYKNYRAQILADGRRISKCFPFTPEGEKHAAIWYNQKAIEHFGEFAFLNHISTF